MAIINYEIHEIHLARRHSNLEFADILPRINSEIKRLGESSKHLAELVGVSEATMSRYLNGASEPSFGTVAKIAVVLGISLDDLIGIEKADGETAAISKRLIDLYERGLSIKNTQIKYLGIISVSLASVFAFLIIWDVMHPNMGYIRYETLLNNFGSFLGRPM